jgi:hypothetical protein
MQSSSKRSIALHAASQYRYQKQKSKGWKIRAHVERESNQGLHPTDVHGVITDVTLLLLESGRRL